MRPQINREISIGCILSPPCFHLQGFVTYSNTSMVDACQKNRPVSRVHISLLHHNKIKINGNFRLSKMSFRFST